MMMGIQEKFSWNAVATAGIGSLAGSAFGAMFGPGVASSALGNAATQVLSPGPNKFSWASVAAAALGSKIPNGMGPASLGTTTARALVDATSQSVIEGTDFDLALRNALPRVIGQTIGQAIAGEIVGGLARRGSNDIMMGGVVEPDDGRVGRPGADDLSLERAKIFLDRANGDPAAARKLALRNYGPSYEEAAAAGAPMSGSWGDIVRNVALSGGGYDGRSDVVIGDGVKHWNEDWTTFGHMEFDDASMQVASWRENAEVMAHANADLAELNTGFALYFGSGAIAGLAPVALPYVGGAFGLSGAGLTTFEILGGGIIGGGASGAAFRGATGQENSVQTFAIDSAFGVGFGLAGRYGAPALKSMWNGAADLFGSLRGAMPRIAMYSGGDRLIGSMGSARLNNAIELDAIVSDLRAQGVSISFREGQFAYGPAPSGGRSGNIVFDPDGSISAVRHEYGHFLDDQARGFPGQRFYYENPGARVATERSQYLGEIRTARKFGDRDARRALIQDYLSERNYIVEKYYTKPYGGR